MMRSARQPGRHQAEAFTLADLAVAAAILVLASALSFPAMVRGYQQQKLRQAAIELQSLLQQGRSVAVRLQGSCGISYGTDGANGVVAEATPSVNFNGTNICLVPSDTTATNYNAELAKPRIAPLRLSQISAVTGLTLNQDDISPNGDVASKSCNTKTACAATFNTLGVLSGNRQILYLSGSGTTTQYCVNLSLSLIRVGFRNSGSGACTYARN